MVNGQWSIEKIKVEDVFCSSKMLVADFFDRYSPVLNFRPQCQPMYRSRSRESTKKRKHDALSILKDLMFTPFKTLTSLNIHR